jgi:hypothetical protein
VPERIKKRGADMKEFSVDDLKAIAEYYRTHTVEQTKTCMKCSDTTIMRAAKMFGVEKIRGKNKEKTKKTKSKNADEKPSKPPISWTPPSLAAAQHEVYKGVPIFQ